MKINSNEIIIKKHRKTIFQKLCSGTADNNPIPTWYFATSDQIGECKKNARKNNAKFIAKIQKTVAYEQIHGILKSVSDDNLPTFAFSINLTPIGHNDEVTQISFILNPIFSCDEIDEDDFSRSPVTTNTNMKNLKNNFRNSHPLYKKSIPVLTGVTIASIAFLLLSPFPSMMFDYDDINSVDALSIDKYSQISSTYQTELIHKEILHQSPDNIASQITTAIIDRNQGNTQDSIDRLQSIVDKNPDNIASKILLDDIYTQQGSYQQIQESYDDIISQNPDDLTSIILQASLSLKTDDDIKTRHSLESLETYIERHSDSLGAKLLRDKILVEQGYSYAHILDNHNEALSENPNDFDSTILKSSVLELSGNLDEALTLLTNYSFENRKSIFSDDDDSIIINLLKGNIYLQLNEFEKASQVYQSALDKNSGITGAILGYNHAVSMLGDFEKIIGYDPGYTSTAVVSWSGEENKDLGFIQDAFGDEVSTTVGSDDDSAQTIELITQRTMEIVFIKAPPVMESTFAEVTFNTVQVKTATTTEQPVATVEPDVVATVEPDVVATVEQPDVVATVEQPDVVATVEQPDVVATVEQPDVVATVEQPDVVATVEQPDVVATVELSPITILEEAPTVDAPRDTALDIPTSPQNNIVSVTLLDTIFDAPNSIVIDDDGNFYVVDTPADENDPIIHKFDSDGNSLSSLDDFTCDFFNHTNCIRPDGQDLFQSGDAGKFFRPSSISVDSGNNLYVADSFNSVIHKFDSNFNPVHSIGSFCDITSINNSDCDGKFNKPSSISVDSGNNLYVADSHNYRIQQFDSAGNFLMKFGSPGNDPGEFGFDLRVTTPQSDDSILVSDINNIRIQKFDSVGNLDESFQTNLGFSPDGVAIDSANNVIYVTNPFGNRIATLDIDSGNQIHSFDNGADSFDRPVGIALDASNINLYIADSENNRIVQVPVVNLLPSASSPSQLSLILAETSVSSNDTGNELTDGDTVPKNNDSDGDGIQNELDVQPDVPSVQFILNNVMTGTILAGFDVISITADASSNGGAIVAASGFTQISICDDASIITLDAGDVILARCGSAIIDVYSGAVDVEFVSDDDNTVGTAILQQNQGLKFDPDDSTVTSYSQDTLILSMGSQEITLMPNQTVELSLQDISLQPAAEDVVVEPDAEDVVVEPDAEDVVVEPDAEDVVVEPDAEDVVVEPDAEDVVVEPDAEDVVVEPDAEDVVVEPDAEDVVVEPDAEDVVVEPDAEDVVVEPAIKPEGITTNFTKLSTSSSDVISSFKTSALSSSSPAKKTGGSCNDCTPPTLGVNKDGKRMVDDGFAFQGIPVDAQLFYTPFPLLGIQIGQEYTTTMKIYENRGPQAVKHVGLAFGLDKGQSFGDSKVVIELDRTLLGEEFTVSVTDPGNILEDNVHAETGNGPCLDAEEKETSERCLIVNIHHTFREPLPYKKIGTYVWDFHRNGWQNYFNHGILIQGDSLNPDKTVNIQHGREALTLTMQDVYGTVATDEYGNTWNYDKTYNSWTTKHVTQQPQDVSVPMNGLDRADTRWNLYKNGQELLAQHTLEHNIMYGKQMSNPDFYDADNYHIILIKITDRADDPELQENIILEQKRAQDTFEKEYWKQN